MKKEETKKAVKKAPKEFTKEEKSAKAVAAMNEATAEAKEAWDEIDKKTRKIVKDFLTEWKQKAGWKKLAKMMAGVDWE